MAETKLEKQASVLNEKFKDCDPNTTIAFLKGILDAMNIEVEETWQERSSIGTWALRVTFKNTTIR